jgi:hypothetical protein
VEPTLRARIPSKKFFMMGEAEIYSAVDKAARFMKRIEIRNITKGDGGQDLDDRSIFFFVFLHGIYMEGSLALKALLRGMVLNIECG